MLSLKKSGQNKNFKENIKGFKSHKYFWSSYIANSTRSEYYKSYAEGLELFSIP